ncbi:class I SAM-dependent methyltransferase [Solidesulfovibrio sp. C21]|uniref:class I SAM-dependent methyltransferase n=1 Tax=Solidesulfovibrio sp. C21 TaxID=3398613 RepID=UPI0039FCBC03
MTYETHAPYDDDLDDKDRNFWTATAEGYDAWIANDFKDQYEVNWNILAKHVDPNIRLLDVGCGPGSLSIRLSRRCHEVWGVDVTPEMIRVAEEKSACEPANVYFQEADACALPFENHSFDTVMSVNALQTMDQPEMAISEMHRVLRPGGELLLITYCYGEATRSEHNALLDWAVRFDGRAMWHSFTFTQLGALLAAKGFEVVEAERIWEGPVVAFLRGRAIHS